MSEKPVRTATLVKVIKSPVLLRFSIVIILFLITIPYIIPSIGLQCKAIPERPRVTSRNTDPAGSAAPGTGLEGPSNLSRASLYDFSGSPLFTLTGGIRRSYDVDILLFEGVKSKIDLQQALYMLEFYKNNTLSSVYNVYKQSLTPLQAESYANGLMTVYEIPVPSELEISLADKPARIAAYDAVQPKIRLNYTIFSGPFSYGSAYTGPWDLWFLLRASDTFWYNHWEEIFPYKEYFNQEDFAIKDALMAEMRKKGITSDSRSLEPLVGADLQLSEEYIRKNIDRVYYTTKFTKPAKSPYTTLFSIFFVILALLLAIRQVSDTGYRKKYTVRQKFY